MSETVSVKSFTGGRDWKSDDGKIALTFYDCVFDRNGSDFEANWGKQQGSGEPSIGESIEGEFFQKDGKWRFRKASKPQAGERSSGKSPDQQRSIVRQHSQGMAIQWAAIQFQGGETLPDEFGLEQLKPLIDWFEADANKAAKEGGGEAPHIQASSPSSAPAPSQQNGQATHERITYLLEGAGVNDVAARTISDFALTELSPEEQDAAIGMLENESRRGAAVKRLSERTVEATGQPLPRPSADESIPFARPEYPALFSERERKSNRP